MLNCGSLQKMNKYYRRLEKGEIISPADEFYNAAVGGWTPTATPGAQAGDPDYAHSTIYRRQVSAAYKLGELIPNVQALLSDCTNEQRLWFFEVVTKGYCSNNGQIKTEHYQDVK